MQGYRFDKLCRFGIEYVAQCTEKLGGGGPQMKKRRDKLILVSTAIMLLAALALGAVSASVIARETLPQLNALELAGPGGGGGSSGT